MFAYFMTSAIFIVQSVSMYKKFSTAINEDDNNIAKARSIANNIDVIDRLKNLYKDNVSVVVVNNIQGKAVQNPRLSLRQGDVPSMTFFTFCIDPLITYLERRLVGILITSIPVFGPPDLLGEIAPVESFNRNLLNMEDKDP